jgi:hypothetical protein
VAIPFPFLHLPDQYLKKNNPTRELFKWYHKAQIQKYAIHFLQSKDNKISRHELTLT